MERIQFIEHPRSRILQVDYSGVQVSGELKRLAQAAAERFGASLRALCWCWST